MLTFEECKKKAEAILNNADIELNKAYKLGTDYVFDNDKVEYMGRLPIVVRPVNGECWGLWPYLNRFNTSMDLMVEIKGGD